MTKSLVDLLAEIEYHQDLVKQHSTIVRRLIRSYCKKREGILPDLSEERATRKRKGRGPTESANHDKWVEWLRRNPPAYRQTIAKATGRKNLAPMGAQILAWSSDIDPLDDTTYLPDRLCKISDSPNGGRGAPKTIYFLYAQRWLVYPLFGVGPDLDWYSTFWPWKSDLSAIDTTPMTYVVRRS